MQMSQPDPSDVERRTVLKSLGTLSTAGVVGLAGCGGGGDGNESDGDVVGEDTPTDGMEDGEETTTGTGDGETTEMTTEEETTTGEETTTEETTTGEESPTVQVRANENFDGLEHLVGPEEMTLYVFEQDEPGTQESACTEGCAETWPPLTPDSGMGGGMDGDQTTTEDETGAEETGTETETGAEETTTEGGTGDETGTETETGAEETTTEDGTGDGEVTAGEGVTAEVGTFDRGDGTTQVTVNGWPLYYYSEDQQPGDANGQGVQNSWWVVAPDGTPVRGGESTETGTETGTERISIGDLL